MNKNFTKSIPVFTVLLIGLLSSTFSQAQELNVTLKVMNPKRDPVSFASITLINRADSNQTRHKAADSTGLAYFKLAKGQWTIRISSVNYQSFEKTVTVNANQTFFNCTLESGGKTMGEVVVTAQKPLMRQEDDKTIVDPENLAAMSTSGYEVIEKTPGLFVDQDGNIYISSLSPASIQINGQDMKMSAGDMASLLKSLPPAAIARIEIVRTPSAKYDASSSGGIVNVVLKKGFKIGMTGSVNTGLQQGRYGNQFAGFNLNNNDGKRNSYINLNYSRRNTYEKIVTDRIFAPDSMLSQDAFTKYPSVVYFAGYGLNYSVGKKWVIDFSGNINLNKFDNFTDNRSAIKKISSSQVLADNLNHVNNQGSSLVVGNGVEAKLKIDTIGSEWSTNVFFYFSHNTADQVFTTLYYTPAFPESGGDGNSDNKRKFFSAKSDLK
ncbi:MAG TPA: carboxypeptidase regulatory-like domain-containing protein, partial [Chitinophagaceae bacterium]|nr:carboxypeptidase regulatory-like domain-containing protein [Chitinophagaceae bacterium]